MKKKRLKTSLLKRLRLKLEKSSKSSNKRRGKTSSKSFKMSIQMHSLKVKILAIPSLERRRQIRMRMIMFWTKHLISTM
jgi:hypothetical protein